MSKGRFLSIWIAVLTLIMALSGLVWAQEGITSENGHGRKTIIGPAGSETIVLELWGKPGEMGTAYGQLCKTEIHDFLAKLRSAMQEGFGVTPEALIPIWQQMAPYVRPEYKEEMAALAAAADVPLSELEALHAIPDVSEFHCSFFAAWGDATRDGHMIQIRALDYERGAFLQTYPMIVCYWPETEGSVPWVSVTFMGFIGTVTGMNSEHIAMSEIGDDFRFDQETLVGKPLEFVMRDALEKSRTLDEALAQVRDSKRTSSLLYCLSDAKLPDARALATAPDVFKAWDWTNLPSDLPALEDCVYMSMGMVSKWTPRFYDVLSKGWGRIDPTYAMEDVMKGLGTGDLHSVAFDVTDLKLWAAYADLSGTDGYLRPFVEFDYGKALAERKGN